MKSEDLYDEDILLWSEQRADALRRQALNEIDWENVAEEIVDVGRRELRAAASHLVRASCPISKPRRGRYPARRPLASGGTAGSGTTHGLPSRGRWRSGRSWTSRCIAAPSAGCQT
jgi:hypothetical protein